MTWPVQKLEQVALPQKGSIVSGPFGSNIGSRFFVDEGVPVIRGNNLSFGKRKFFDDGFVYLTEEKAQEFHNCNALKGDLVFTAAGTIGQVGIIPANARFERYIISNKQLRVRCDLSKVDPTFLFLWFSTDEMRQHIIGKNTGSSIPLINLTILRGLPVPVPPLDTQRRIASKIAAYDDLIENNQRRIQLLEEAARRLYREWFVALRFPGHERVQFVDGVPQGWERVALAAIATVNESTVSIKNPPDTLRYLDISSVGTGVIHEATEYAFADAPGRARRKVKHGDTIWSCVRPNRRSYALIWEPAENLIASTGFAVLTPKTVPFAYFHLAATTDEFVGHLTSNATGAAYPAVSAKDFESAALLKPTDAILEAFDQRVTPLLAQQDVLQRHCKSLKQARDALLPRLMSGALAV